MDTFRGPSSNVSPSPPPVRAELPVRGQDVRDALDARRRQTKRELAAAVFATVVGVSAWLAMALHGWGAEWPPMGRVGLDLLTLVSAFGWLPWRRSRRKERELREELRRLTAAS